MYRIGSPPKKYKETSSGLVYTHSLRLWVVDKLLLNHIELPCVLDLIVHLVNLVGWMVIGDHSKTFFYNWNFFTGTLLCG